MKINHPKAKAFMRKIRTYNSAHIFASMAASISSPPVRGPYCFRIHGQVYHNTTPMEENTNNPKYDDLYFMYSSQALEFRDNNEVRCTLKKCTLHAWCAALYDASSLIANSTKRVC